MKTSRTGKIARMPVAIRAEVNRRLDENQGGAKILGWLNGQADALRILDEYFGEEPVTPQNLSEWRQGGYQDYLRQREQVERTKELADYALKLGVASGGNLADGSAAIAGGKILSVIEDAEGEQLDGLIKSLFLLRSGDTEKAKLDLRRQVVAQRQQSLDLEKKKFQRVTCELFLKWYDKKKARDIVESRHSNDEKVELLGQEIFGEDWA